jgi:uncharacterized protein YtpQ (UPF0354 family)
MLGFEHNKETTNIEINTSKKQTTIFMPLKMAKYGQNMSSFMITY